MTSTSSQISLEVSRDRRSSRNDKAAGASDQLQRPCCFVSAESRSSSDLERLRADAGITIGDRGDAVGARGQAQCAETVGSPDSEGCCESLVALDSTIRGGTDPLIRLLSECSGKRVDSAAQLPAQVRHISHITHEHGWLEADRRVALGELSRNRLKGLI